MCCSQTPLFIVACDGSYYTFRGVYLASLLFTDEEKLLVTLDDNIPIVEVDDNYPSTFMQDFCWLMKVVTICYFPS